MNVERPSNAHQQSIDLLEVMEKNLKTIETSELPPRQLDENAPRRPKRTYHAIAAALLFLVLTFWFITIHPVFTIGQHGCTHKLTVEQRAAKILKKHPLVG